MGVAAFGLRSGGFEFTGFGAADFFAAGRTVGACWILGVDFFVLGAGAFLSFEIGLGEGLSGVGREAVFELEFFGD